MKHKTIAKWTDEGARQTHEQVSPTPDAAATVHAQTVQRFVDEFAETARAEEGSISVQTKYGPGRQTTVVILSGTNFDQIATVKTQRDY